MLVQAAKLLGAGNFRPIYAVVFWLFVADFCLLAWSRTTPVVNRVKKA